MLGLSTPMSGQFPSLASARDIYPLRLRQRASIAYRPWQLTKSFKRSLQTYSNVLVVNQHTSAGARVHEGIRCASVSNPNRSSAAAMNVASLTILDVLRNAFVIAVGAANGVAAPEAVIDADVGAGVPVRLGSPLTVKSLPCFSMIATGNSANLASRAAGRRSSARA